MNNLCIKATKMRSFLKYNAMFSLNHKIFKNNSCITVLTEKLGALSFHTTSNLDRFGPPVPRPTTYKHPVDWLPFPWHRRPKFNLYQRSGDLITNIPINPDDPKPDFELSEELKTANETVKRTFTLATCTKGEAREVMQRDLLKRVQRHPLDFDSLEVKIALMTVRIRSLFEHHHKCWRKEIRNSRLILPILIQKRNKLLKRLWLIDEARLQWVLKELDLYYDPPKMALKLEHYCKKWDIRKLTREYCEKKIAEKKAAYHEELKKEQEAFLEEKKQVLAWIEEEEKALQSISSQ